MKKILSMALACLTLFGSVSVRAKSDVAKQNTHSPKVCGSVIAGVTAVAMAGVVLVPFACFKICDYFPAITVGTPKHNLTRDDLKKHSKKEEVEINGFMPQIAGIAGQKILIDVVRATTIKIRDGVTGIDKYAFDDCSGTKRIIIPNSVKHIESDAFHSGHFCFNPKIIYNGKDYANTEAFLKEFNKTTNNQ